MRTLEQKLRLVFLGVLLFTTAQVVWWVYDQDRYTRRTTYEISALYQSQTRSAQAMLDQGVSAEEVEALHPHQKVQGDQVGVRPSSLKHLQQRHASRVNQYRWEGAFFLLVLLISVGVLRRTIRAEANLRRRQQDFVAAVSHELKSPLASLQLAVDTLDARELDFAGRKRWLSRMNTELQRLGRMIANILDITRLDGRGLKLQPQRLKLQEQVAQVVGALEPRMQAAQVPLQVQVSGHILADPAGVEVVLRNLLENALNACIAQPGGDIRVTSEIDGEHVALTVQDRGIGFPPDEARRLFERFYRVGDELQRRTPGTGLGLSIARSYIRKDGGSLRAHSEGPGQGARFVARWRRGE